jgi:hypothetical protein
VGWLGVRLLSRNKTQRKKARQGLGIWTTVFVSTACIFLIILACKGGGTPDFSNFNFGGGSSSSQSKHKKAAPDQDQPPLYTPSPKVTQPL